ANSVSSPKVTSLVRYTWPLMVGCAKAAVAIRAMTATAVNTIDSFRIILAPLSLFCGFWFAYGSTRRHRGRLRKVSLFPFPAPFRDCVWAAFLRRLHQSTERSHLLSHCATAGNRDWQHFTLPVGSLYSPTWSGFLLSVENFFLGNTANHSPPSGLVSPRTRSFLPFRSMPSDGRARELLEAERLHGIEPRRLHGGVDPKE